MIKTILECDRCGKRCEYDSIHACVDCKMDAAGSMDNEYESVDLCFACAHSLLRQMVKEIDYEQAKNWMTLVRTKPPVMRM